MFHESPVSGFKICATNRVHHGFVIGPDAAQIIVISENIKPNGLIGFPIGFQYSIHKRIIQSAIDGEVELFVFVMGYLNRSAV